MLKMMFPIFAFGLFCGQIHGALPTRIDSVTVDSVWNADTTDQYGLVTIRRDVLLSFLPVADDSVNCVVDLSLDSGTTWNFSRDFCDRIDAIGLTRAAPNVKRTIHLRVYNGDTTDVVFRVTAQTDTTALADLRILGPQDGWSETGGTYTYFWDDRSMALIMDGFYYNFIQHGMVNGFANTLTKQASLSDLQYVMECGTEARAQAVFQALRPITDTVTLAFPDSVATARTTLNGVTAYAHFGHFYFQAGLTGYTVRDSALADANILLNFFRSRSVH